jgi:PHD/YefM family antitoxin component YafN of YafNO toxin-antitoxin module
MFNKTSYKGYKMQIAYKREEMVGVTELSRGLNSFVDKVKNHTIEKLAIMKNNKPEVIMISTAEYERIKELSDIIEYHSIADIVEERMPDGKIGKTISLDEYHTKRMTRRHKNVR